MSNQQPATGAAINMADDTPDEVEAITQKPADQVIGEALTRVAEAATSAPLVAQEEQESLSVSLPPTLDYLDNVPNTLNGTALEIRLYGEGCLECKHLVPTAAEPVDPCHFSNGNRFCPAGFHRIVFIGERMRYVQRIRRYQEKKDTNRLLKVLTELENHDLETKNFVLAEVGLLER